MSTDVEPYNWAVRLTDSKYLDSIKVVADDKLPAPPGFKNPTGFQKDTNTKEGGEKKNSSESAQNIDYDALQIKKSWQLAMEPIRTIPVNLIMSYMTGSSLNIIPIMTALMLLSGPLKSILTVGETFKPVLGNRATSGPVKLSMFIYVLAQTLLIYIGFRKLNQMGLIPNTKSDWLAWERPASYSKFVKSFVL